MTTLRTPPATGFATFAARAGHSVRNAVHAYLRYRRNRIAVKDLMSWNDHMLDDIGLTRSDVRRVLRETRKVDPSSRLRILAVERRATHRADALRRLEVAAVDGRLTGRFGPAATACEA